VRLLEQPELHQLAHRPAHRRRRDRQLAEVERVARADRLSRLDVAPQHREQHVGEPPGQIAQVAHRWQWRNAA